MAKTVILDELVLTFRIHADLPDAEVDAGAQVAVEGSAAPARVVELPFRAS